MKTFQKSKMMLALAFTTLLGACDDDYVKPDDGVNAAPEHGGDIVRTYNEADAFEFLYLLGTPDGAKNGEGIAFDPDGDILYIDGFSSDAEDMTGFEFEGNKLGIRPSAIAPNLDTGDTLTVNFSYNISDGEAAVPRTITVTVIGEDFAPVFEDLTVSFTKFDEQGIVDLLEGVVDADGEALSISGFTADAANKFDIHSLDGSVLTLDIASISEQIALGETVSLVFNYDVEDHNHSLPRKATINIRGVRPEPLPPEVVMTYEGNLTNNDDMVYVDFADEKYTVEWNGDPILVDVDSIMPVDGGPALMFNKSSGSVLVIDPVDFSKYVAANGDMASWEYSFNLTDGEEGETAGHVVESSFVINFTRQEPTSLLTNGGFESGDLTGWTVADSSLVSVVATGDASEGAYQLEASGETTIKQSFDVQPGGAYYVRQTDRIGNWGRYSAWINGGEVPVYQSWGFHPPFVGGAEVPWKEHNTNVTSFVLASDDATTSRELTLGTSLISLDDVFAGRFSSDPVNNAVYQSGSNNVNFEDGTLGAWTGGNIAIESVTPINGLHSLRATGWAAANLALPKGTIENGKKYLLRLIVVAKKHDGNGFSPITLNLFDTNEGEVTSVFGDDLQSQIQPRTRNMVNHPLDEVFVIEQFINVDAYNSITDWNERGVTIQFKPSLWSGNGDFIVDDVQLVEVE
ncbi:hypothetical protein FE810_09660 [Thalassotalea litorea]|uniref:RapA2 cadherin-like domain-containing protein n=1 Tax=Thalassotalea litorea TaxID=2020715 RepID=A0A5R9IPM9_9GAMM|nr:Ig-like domain-containing protein [Thalassotalea litorea]TLU65176.1 hypothetical protein FE810_09660 [Thalassotalea litorea]